MEDTITLEEGEVADILTTTREDFLSPPHLHSFPHMQTLNSPLPDHRVKYATKWDTLLLVVTTE